MPIDLWLVGGAFLVSIVVGLTGMGGGALMTPMLIVLFHVSPVAAVSSDLVSSAVTKPFGGFVHLRHGTVHRGLVRALVTGSVPGAFAGVLLSHLLGHGAGVEHVVRFAMGVALLIAAAGLTVRAYLALAERARRRANRTGEPASTAMPDVTVRLIPTVLIGSVGGILVGMTSVGSGSLIIVGLIALYPGLKANQLVGTDLVQSAPLVIAAALGNVLFGGFHPALTVALLIGSIPGVYVGARLAAWAPGGLVRRMLGMVLLASALKMFEVGNTVTVTLLLATAIGGSVLWALIRKRHGLPALASAEHRAPS